MIKIKEEKAEIVMEKKELKMEREKDKEITKIKTEYQKKVEDNLEKNLKEMKDMYGQILQLVPNIGVKLKGDITK